MAVGEKMQKKRKAYAKAANNYNVGHRNNQVNVL